MSTPIYYPNQAAWSEPLEVAGSGARLYPIPTEPSAYQIRRSYAVDAAQYGAAQLDTSIIDGGTPLYLVQETVTTRTPAFVHFTRLYSTIPSARSEVESYPFSFPGLSTSVTYGTSVTATSGNFNIPGELTLAIGTHGFTAGTSLLDLSLKLSHIHDGTLNLTLGRKPISVTATTVTVDWSASGYAFLAGSVRERTNRDARAPITRNVTSRLDYDYILPGVTPGYETGNDILTLDTFAVSNSDGEETDTLSTTTTPTQADYEGYIDDGDYVVAESYVRRWHGNIYERVTRMVRAE